MENIIKFLNKNPVYQLAHGSFKTAACFPAELPEKFTPRTPYPKVNPKPLNPKPNYGCQSPFPARTFPTTMLLALGIRELFKSGLPAPKP